MKLYRVVADIMEWQTDSARGESWDQLMPSVSRFVDEDGLQRLLRDRKKVPYIASIEKVTLTPHLIGAAIEQARKNAEHSEAETNRQGRIALLKRQEDEARRERERLENP